MNDDQPNQPLTDAELAQIREDYEGVDPYDSVPRLLAEVDRLRAEIATMGRYMHELDRENERLRLGAVQMESGAQIAMNAGVVALQEVKRLEIERDDLKIINDRMAEDRLRLVDERDRLITERDDLASRLDVREVINQTIGELQTELKQLRAEATGTALGHLAKIERLQSQRDALVRKLGLDWGPDEFGDLDAVPTDGNADRGEMLSDLQWYISDLGPEHWQNCPMDDEDCYLCAGHVAIRDRWKGVE